MKTREQLEEMDRDELLNEIRQASGLEIDDKSLNSDLQIGTWQTADGYEVHVIMNGNYMSDMCWESDVYYYTPDVKVILDRLTDLAPGDKVYCDDTDEYFDNEDVMIDWLIDNFPENYDDEV